MTVNTCDTVSTSVHTWPLRAMEHRRGAPTPARTPVREASEGEGPQRRPRRRVDWRLEEVAKAVAGGYCRLQTPLKRALGVRETVAGNRLGALEGGGGTPCVPFRLVVVVVPPPPPLPMHS